VSDLSHGIAQDYAEALRLYRLAAAQGLAAAQSNLGYMYHMGQGVAPDRAEAIRWFRLAAAQGFAVAITSLNILGA
jgi:TPR repeat protein